MIWILSEDEDVEGNEDHEDVEARGYQVDSSRVPVQSLTRKFIDICYNRKLGNQIVYRCNL